VQAGSFLCDVISSMKINTFLVSFSPFYKRVEEKGKKRRIKGMTMAQWMDLLQNNSLVN